MGRCSLYIHIDFWSKFCLFLLNDAIHVDTWQAVWRVIFKICVIFVVWFERQKVDKKQTYTKTEAYNLYSRVFWIFLPNIIKIDQWNFELYRFKVGAFFWDTVYVWSGRSAGINSLTGCVKLTKTTITSYHSAGQYQVHMFQSIDRTCLLHNSCQLAFHLCT